MAMLNRLFFIALTSVAAIATAFAYGIGGHLALNGTVTVGTLLAITALLARLYGPLTALSNVRIDVMTALVSFERVFEVLDLTPMVSNKNGAQELAKKIPSIEFKNVSFSYPRPDQISLASLESAAKEEFIESGEVLKNVTFTVPAGSFTAIVGPSGAGKTTIVDTLLGVLTPDSGQVLVSGLKPLAASARWSGAISYLPQEVFISMGSVRENVCLGYPIEIASDERVLECLRLAHLEEFVLGLPHGLEARVGENGTQLSGGQRQRLGIARALFTNPKLIVLDESTSALDAETEAAVSEAIVSLKGEITIVMIAHRLSTVRKADQVYYLSDGKLLASGTFDEVRNAVPNFNEQAILMGL